MHSRGDYRAPEQEGAKNLQYVGMGAFVLYLVLKICASPDVNNMFTEYTRLDKPAHIQCLEIYQYTEHKRWYATEYEKRQRVCFMRICIYRHAFLMGMTRLASLDPMLGVVFIRYAGFVGYLVQRWNLAIDSINVASRPMHTCHAPVCMAASAVAY